MSEVPADQPERPPDSSATPKDDAKPNDETKPDSGLRRRLRIYRNLLLGLLLTIIVVPCCIRTYRLMLLPHVPVSITEADLKRTPPPDEQNAFDWYGQATDRLVPLLKDTNDKEDHYIRDDLEIAWQLEPERLTDGQLDWLNENQAALATWKKGTTCDEAVVIDPDWAHVTLHYKPQLISVEVRAERDDLYLAWLTLLEANRQLRDGHPDESRQLLTGMLRFSLHLGWQGNLLETSSASTVETYAAIGLIRWSQHPSVDAKLIRLTIQELQAAGKLALPVSRILKHDLLEYEQKTVPLGGRFYRAFEWPVWFPQWPRKPIGWTLGEPELSIRQTRLLYRNALPIADLPRCERPAPLERDDQNYVSAFDECDENRLSVSVEKLRRVSTAMANEDLPDLVRGLGYTRARLKLLPAALAVVLWHKEHGEYPASLEEAVQVVGVTDIADPMSENKQSLGYRKKDGAVLVHCEVAEAFTIDGDNAFGYWIPDDPDYEEEQESESPAAEQDSEASDGDNSESP